MVSRRSRPRSSRRAAPRETREWVGGRLIPPVYIEDRQEPYRAEFVIWLELPSGLVVSLDVLAPEDSPGALGRSLRQGMAEPMSGPPRQPDAIRVADAALAEEVREVVGDAIPVRQGPTPELDRFLQLMLEDMPGDDGSMGSHLADGRVPEELASKLYSSASVLYEIAPWDVAGDDQVLRMDIPSLGVDGACVTVIGALGESYGVLIFPSLTAYDTFTDNAMERTDKEPIDLGTDWLVLDYAEEEEVPASVVQHVEKQGWPVAASAYPRVEHRDRDGACRPLTERDVRVVLACTSALAGFFVKNRSLFTADEIDPVCQSWYDRNDLEVRFTFPYEAYDCFDLEDVDPSVSVAAVAPAPVSGHRAGRNDPCPCGSGRKYKKCCLGRDEAAQRERGTKAETGRLEDQWIDTLARYAVDRFGVDIDHLAPDFRDLERGAMLALPWAVYGAEIEGRSVADAYLADRGGRLDPADREWLHAQQAAWLTVWEVTSIDPGRGVSVRDLLSDETRWVDDVSVSHSAVPRDAVLARVVEFRGICVFSGMHPYALPPARAAELVERTRRWLRRKRAVPVERLRAAETGGYLIRRWEEAADELEAQRDNPPQLSNFDGDPLILVVDHFEIAQGSSAELEARLAAMEGVEPPDPHDEEGLYGFLRPGHGAGGGIESTVVGNAQIRKGRLTLSTNSRERADALRQRVEAACGGLIAHLGRELIDPLSDKVDRPSESSAPPIPEPEARQLILDFKENYYADWLDQPIPALDGKSPREAVRTADGRRAVDLLLKDIENRELRFQPETAIDVSRLRRELHLE